MIGAKVLHTSGITQAISETACAAVDMAVDLVARAGHTVSYDLNIRPRLWPVERARPVVERTLARAHLVFLSDEDATYLYPSLESDAVIRRLLGFGPQTVVFKRGAQGCVVATAAGISFQTPAWPIDVVDATGAGDAFAGAFIASWLGGANLHAAARVATAAGALTTTGLGAVGPIPTRAQITEFIDAESRAARSREPLR
jgi:2-dehydro-3-deoxygluconokinase